MDRDEWSAISFARVAGTAGRNHILQRVIALLGKGCDVVLGQPLHLATAVDAAMVVMLLDGLPLGRREIVHRGSSFVGTTPAVFRGHFVRMCLCPSASPGVYRLSSLLTVELFVLGIFMMIGPFPGADTFGMRLMVGPIIGLSFCDMLTVILTSLGVAALSIALAISADVVNMLVIIRTVISTSVLNIGLTIRACVGISLLFIGLVISTITGTSGFWIFVGHGAPRIREGIKRGEWLVVDETTQAADLLPLKTSVA